MFKISMVMAWAVFVVSTASARIGWTLEQCRKHYGPETPCVPATSELTDFFTVGKSHLGIHFAADGKADSILYFRVKSEGDFTELEGKTLMDRNCGELSWVYYNQYWIPQSNPYWVSQGGDFIAVK